MGPRRLSHDVDDASESITAADVGLPDGTPLPWRFHPETTASPLVISFPHVGLSWSDELGSPPPADFARNADYEVQTLYREAAAHGGARIEAVYSRLVVDLNRAGDDISGLVVPEHPAPRPRQRPGSPSVAGQPEADPMRPGRGVVWVKALGDVPLFTPPMPYEAFKARIDRFHEPYYRAIEVLLERRRRRFGYAILLDAHSMPGSVGVDLVLGTLAGTSCASEVQRRALAAISGESGHRLRVRLNEPYHGGELVRRFGRPSEGLHALQLEVNRGLYMDEHSLALWESPNHLSSESPGHPPGDAAASRDAAAVRNPGVGPRPTTEATRSAPAAPSRSASHRPASHPRHTEPGRGATDPGGPENRAALVRVATTSNKQARDFSALRERVSCLIAVLGERLDPRSLSGTSSPGTRVTDGRAGRRDESSQPHPLPLSPGASKR